LKRAFGVVVAVVLAGLGNEANAHAAGLYFSERGVRPLGRGGAFVAGADDLGATWYNPAGLADAGTSILSDFAWLHFTSDFTRQTLVTDMSGATHVVVSPGVQGTSPVLPIPTLGGSLNFGPRHEWTIALGAFAPYTAIASYPLTLGGAPSPSRYSLVSLDGSALIITGLWAAYKPIEWLRIGAGFEALVGSFDATTVFSASPPDRLISAPEDPQYDSLSQLRVGPIFAPSGNAGATFVPDPHVAIGVSGQLPFWVDAPAHVTVKLPTAVEFDNAQQSGDSAHVRFQLPAVARAGVEYRGALGPGRIRTEVTYVREFWSIQESIQIIPTNLALTGITGFPSPFAVAPITLPRHFKDANSLRAGAEYSFTLAGYGFDARAGVNLEESAIPNAYLSPLTVDLDKITATVGGSLRVGDHWRFDAVYAHVFAMDTTVAPGTAAVPRVNPVQGNPTATEAVNGGSYAARADVVGVGLNYRF
jgi:long-chain fatty acid transport protein